MGFAQHEVAFTKAMSWSSFLSRVASRDLMASSALLPGVFFADAEAVATATAENSRINRTIRRDFILLSNLLTNISQDSEYH